MSTAVRSPFGSWLLCQADRDDPVGDLARDTAADPSLPLDESAPAFIETLAIRADSAAMRACLTAVIEWEALA